MAYTWEIFPRVPWPRGFGQERFRPRWRNGEHLDGDQLELELWRIQATPRDRTPLEQLQLVLERSRLARGAFAQWALGCTDFTLARYLAGAWIPECKRILFSRLESVSVHGDRLLITVNVGPELRRRYERRKKNVAHRPQRR